MIRVDTYAVTLQIKGKLAVFDMLQLILVEIRPSPQTGIDDMRETLASRHLGTTENSKGKESRHS